MHTRTARIVGHSDERTQVSRQTLACACLLPFVPHGCRLLAKNTSKKQHTFPHPPKLQPCLANLATIRSQPLSRAYTDRVERLSDQILPRPPSSGPVGIRTPATCVVTTRIQGRVRDGGGGRGEEAARRIPNHGRRARKAPRRRLKPPARRAGAADCAKRKPFSPIVRG
jgi:hypothetical protein